MLRMGVVLISRTRQIKEAAWNSIIVRDHVSQKIFLQMLGIKRMILDEVRAPLLTLFARNDNAHKYVEIK